MIWTGPPTRSYDWDVLRFTVPRLRDILVTTVCYAPLAGLIPVPPCGYTGSHAATTHTPLVVHYILLCAGYLPDCTFCAVWTCPFTRTHTAPHHLPLLRLVTAVPHYAATPHVRSQFTGPFWFSSFQDYLCHRSAILHVTRAFTPRTRAHIRTHTHTRTAHHHTTHTGWIVPHHALRCLPGLPAGYICTRFGCCPDLVCLGFDSLRYTRSHLLVVHCHCISPPSVPILVRVPTRAYIY